jgi:upstream activation factor subunit UAF30
MKPAIKALIMERFDLFAQKNGVGAASEEDAVPTTEPVNGHDESNGTAATPGVEYSPPTSSYSNKRQAESDFSRESGSKTPPPKKRKPDHDIDADALFAARLQAEENKLARPTRGSATRKSAPVKKKTVKSKTAKKVKAEDDSDLESGSENGTKKEVNRSGGFHVSFLNFYH